MTESIREVAEGVKVQGANERITYAITTTNCASDPASPSMIVERMSDGTDVTDDVVTGDISANGDVITLKAISGLTAGERYKVKVQFTATGFAPAECFFYIDCEA